jgi:group II intron reverse transcriptase/maturase
MLKRNTSTGVDGVSYDQYEENLSENIERLIIRMKSWSYRPQPVRRIYIPKSSGKKRPIGIPAIEDKMVQMCITRILTSIYEADFLDISYGFRPQRNCHDGIERLDYMLKWNRVNYVIDADIKGFFDSMDHKWMIRMLEERISDKHLLRLIKRFLRNGYLEDGKEYKKTEGTPQGGVLSPILANIYLHYALDLWFERIVKRHTEGFTGMVRYADDYIIGSQYKREAERIMRALKKRLRKFNLELSEDKSRLLRFGKFAPEKAKREGKKAETFDFLGFTHYCTKDRKGNYKVGHKIAHKRYVAKVKEMKMWLKAVRNIKIREWWGILIAKIRGHYQYYGISGNIRSLERFYQEVRRLLYKWLNRRSQKRSFNSKNFQLYLERYPLPRPKIEVNVDEEPVAGKPHGGFCEGLPLFFKVLEVQ